MGKVDGHGVPFRAHRPGRRTVCRHPLVRLGHAWDGGCLRAALRCAACCRSAYSRPNFMKFLLQVLIFSRKVAGLRGAIRPKGPWVCCSFFLQPISSRESHATSFSASFPFVDAGRRGRPGALLASPAATRPGAGPYPARPRGGAGPPRGLRAFFLPRQRQEAGRVMRSELCRRLVDAIGKKLEIKDLKTSCLMVTPGYPHFVD